MNDFTDLSDLLYKLNKYQTLLKTDLNVNNKELYQKKILSYTNKINNIQQIGGITPEEIKKLTPAEINVICLKKRPNVQEIDKLIKKAKDDNDAIKKFNDAIDAAIVARKAEYDAHYKKLLARIRELETELDMARRASPSAPRSSSPDRGDLKDERERRQKAEERVQELETQLAATRAAAKVTATTGTDAAALEKALADKKKCDAELKSKLEIIVSLQKELETARATSTAHAATNTTNAAALQAERDKHAAALRDKDAAAAAATAAAAAAAKAKSDCDTQLAASQKRIKELEGQLARATAEKETEKAAAATAATAAAAEKDRAVATAATAAKSECTAQLAALQQQIKQLQGQLAAKETEIAEKDRAVARATSESDLLRRKHDKAIGNLEGQIKKLLGGIKELYNVYKNIIGSIIYAQTSKIIELFKIICKGISYNETADIQNMTTEQLFLKVIEILGVRSTLIPGNLDLNAKHVHNNLYKKFHTNGIKPIDIGVGSSVANPVDILGPNLPPSKAALATLINTALGHTDTGHQIQQGTFETNIDTIIREISELKQY
jgi:DNA repair exonuclease SbcCD ATPase subunit